ncbi:MAG: AAA family ATPase, partial [Lentisphaerae bacterium]
MDWMQEILQFFKARIPLIHLETIDEQRVLNAFAALAHHPQWRRGDGVYRWDHADQFTSLVNGIPEFDTGQTATIDTILPIIDGFEGNATFILLDFHQAWTARRTLIRKLRNLADNCSGYRNKNVVIVTPPGIEVPSELEECMYRITIPRPSREELHEILKENAERLLFDAPIPPHVASLLVNAALGLSATRAGQIFRQAFIRSEENGLTETAAEFILREKCRAVRQNPALELYPVAETQCQVGGLYELKSWLAQRRNAFSPEAEAYQLDKPRGIALIGIPGTGKSLCAKMTAFSWHMPLLRLEMGAVFESYLGHSERNLREATQIAERLAPCVLWIDEIEKAFAGSSGDHGTATRLLGYFLSWMQEREEPVFVVATANDIRGMPPEFLRKGRFDEVFFLDLPT